MNRFFYNLRKVIAVVVLLSLTTISVWAANSKTTVDQVSSNVTLADDVDYIVSSSTPFTDAGVVNFTNTEHAVLILEGVRPSVVISKWLGHIQINGEKAVENSNCMVRMYNLGAIVFPYKGGDKFKALTVYSEPNFEGSSSNDLGLEHSGGYMNTLTTKQLNNKIRSFKLKRGYMVTFSLRAGGRGYSRCFIAADKDIEMASLPALMDNSISSYRVFKWYDAGKRQLGNQVDATAMKALNVQSSYDWGTGNATMLPDFEWVPNHIYEDYPSSSSIGKCTWSPHTKNNNEPRNSSDDHPQDLATILNNWENMMRTGLRLCSPASWDGSDLWNATGFLADFLDSIDARGWRCDIIDLHCYWAEGSFGNMHYWSDKYKRPIWISEWCWGASWNNNGAFANGVTENQVRDALQRICTNLNNWDYVERYYYWNGERDPSRLYKNGSLTPAGEMYSKLNSGLGYNGKYDFVPTTPRQYAPTNLDITYDKATNTATLKFHEYNGEMNKAIYLERSVQSSGNTNFEVIDTLDIQENEADYTCQDPNAASGYRYRIQIVDGKEKKQYSNIVMAVSDNMEAGDPYTVGDEVMFMGGNVFANGDFALGTYGWVSGTGDPIDAPYFQAVPVGGKDNDAYLQCYGHGDQNSAASLITAFNATPSVYYYFSGSSANTNLYTRLEQTNPGKSGSYIVASMRNENAAWKTILKVFNTGDKYEQLTMVVRSAQAKAQVGQLMLARLFATQDSAFADGLEKIRLRAEAFKSYNTQYPFLNEDLSAQLALITEANRESLAEAKIMVENAIKAYDVMKTSAPYVAYVEKLVALNLHGKEKLSKLLSDFQNVKTVDAVFAVGAELTETVDEYLPLTTLTGKIKQPKFASATGWTTKCGTFTDGDQTTKKVDNVTFWNAWWSGIPATDLTKTMAVKQDISGLDHGLYSLECKASTEHFCLSDQHGFIAADVNQENSPVLTADYMDLPTVAKADRWQVLLTAPVYVGDNGSLTVGFESSKQGAQDNMWHELGNTSSQGDLREGWWGATDFSLKFTPLYKATVEPNQWGTICLPYAVRPCEGMEFYKIVAINDTYTQLCLEKIDESQAGVPCLYRSEKADAMFLEYGKAMSYTIDGMCNLRGFLKVSNAKAPLNHYVLVNGAWEKVTDNENRPVLQDYSAVIRPLNDAASVPLHVTDHWTGVTMPIHGITEAEIQHNTLGISNPTVATVALPDGFYTLDGRMTIGMDQQNLRPGLYIKVVDGRAFKTVVK